MTYNDLKAFTTQLIHDELHISFEMPSMTNYVISENSFRLFFWLNEVDYIIDIEKDQTINVSHLMVFGPKDYGPFDLNLKNIKKVIKYIKQKMKTQFKVDYYEDSIRLGQMIIDSKHDLSELEINQWLNKQFVDGSFSWLANDLHPKGYTRINHITTQFTYKGLKRTYVKKGLRFILKR